MQLVRQGDERAKIAASASGSQFWISQAPAILVITGTYQRTARKYGRRAERYVDMEAGHAAQNVFLQAEASSLSAAIVGAFDDRKLSSIIAARTGEMPLAVMPVGHREN